ncbi:MAG: glycosyltransferase [Mediterranea sp.]|nr:glycosyltransferase [Mediterranea sp.]
MKTIVVSGINLFMGGTLKVMQDCLSALSRYALANDYQIVAMVYDETLFAHYERVRYISFPKSRKSYLHRLYYEYIGFKKLSKQLRPYAWFSLHDTTPNVVAERQAVYCHNPFPFYRAGWKDLLLQPNIFLLSLLTRHIIYKINIKRNNQVVVQQEWIRQAFRKQFSINNVVVALPMHVTEMTEQKAKPRETGKTIFFYPAGPVVHKNFEAVCKAAVLLEKEGVQNFEVVLTTNGKENRYTQWLFKTYGNAKHIRFEGFLKREEMDHYYQNADCLVFPSKVETWGLPITEAKERHLPILIADRPYAKESVGRYEKVRFFNPHDAGELARVMKSFIDHTIHYDNTFEVNHQGTVTRSWEELFDILFTHKTVCP